MSRIALEPNSSGSGVFTIASPNSNTSRTLNLPDAAGTLDTVQRAGNVLQVVQASTTTTANIASTSYQDTNITATITPTSSSNKILVVINAFGSLFRNGATVYAQAQIVRDSTSVQTFEEIARNNSNAVGNRFAVSFSYLDSPNKTSSTTYKLQGKVDTTADSGQVDFQATSATLTQRSTITLIEIAA
jgi:hypothetical protein